MKGFISISRRENPEPQHEDAERDFHLELTIGDTASGRKFLSIKIDPAELVSAMAGGHQRPLEFEFDEKALALVGRKREHKQFRIRDKGTDRMVVPQRILDEGWQYSTGYGNSHTSFTENNKRYYNCSFIRYIDPVQEDSSFDDEPDDLPWNEPTQKAPSGKQRKPRS